jgi:ribosomal-protein-alanine acetyltransferase
MMDLERQCVTAGHWTEEQYRHALRRGGPERLLLVADASVPIASGDDETRAGAASGIRGFLVAQHLAPEWELENIVVAPTARRKGLGKRLLDALLAASRKTNSNSVFLEVRESNVAARTLYEKAGFDPAGRRKFYYTDPPEDAVLYRRNLR